MALPSFLEQRTTLGIRYIQINPADTPSTNNPLVIAPSTSNPTPDRLASPWRQGNDAPHAALHKNGGGLHPSTTPLHRDPL